MFVLCLPFQMCLCLDLCLFAQIKFLCHVLACFPLWVYCLMVFGAICLFGCICPLWWHVWIQPCVRVHLHDVWLACRLPHSYLLSFSCQGFASQPFQVFYNMLILPLCVIICLLYAILFGFPLFLCTCSYMLMHESLYACSCYQAQFLPMISCGFTLMFVQEISSPF